MKIIKIIKQVFCKHKNTSLYTKRQTFYSLRGETVYRICNDCGKELSSFVREFEGGGYK